MECTGKENTMNNIIKKISASVIAMFMCSTCIASVSAEAPAFIQGKWNYVNSSEQYIRTYTTTSGYINSVMINNYAIFGTFSYDWNRPNDAYLANYSFPYTFTMTNGVYNGNQYPATYYMKYQNREKDYFNINGRIYELV